MAIAATQIIEARAKAEEDWQQSQAVKSRQYMPALQIIQSVLGQQTARFPQLRDRANCGKVTMTWENSCPSDATLFTGVEKINSHLCGPTGTGSSTTKLDYKLGNIIQSPGFAIVDDNCQNVYDNVTLLARGLLNEHKAVVEKLGKVILANNVTFAGKNSYTGKLVQAAAGNVYKISEYDAVASSMVPYLLRAAAANKMTNPFVLMGDALYNNLYIDGKQAGTPADSGYVKMWNDLQMIEAFTEFNALEMNDDFFLIDSGATALVTKYTGSAEPRQLKSDYYLTTMPLLGGIIRDNQGEPLYVDVYHERKNVVVETMAGGQTRCVLADTFQLELKYGYYLNPTACNNGYSGLIHFQKDSTLDPVGIPATYARVPQVPGQVYQAVR